MCVSWWQWVFQASQWKSKVKVERPRGQCEALSVPWKRSWRISWRPRGQGVTESCVWRLGQKNWPKPLQEVKCRSTEPKHSEGQQKNVILFIYVYMCLRCLCSIRPHPSPSPYSAYKTTLLPLNKNHLPVFSPFFSLSFRSFLALFLPSLRVTSDSWLGGISDGPKQWCHCCYFQ